jgi:hypothetical protein
MGSARKSSLKRAEDQSLPPFDHCLLQPAFDRYFYCRSQQAGQCTHALRVMDRYFCKHPQAAKIYSILENS